MEGLVLRVLSQINHKQGADMIWYDIQHDIHQASQWILQGFDSQFIVCQISRKTVKYV